MTSGVPVLAEIGTFGMIGIVYGLLILGMILVSFTTRAGTIARATLKEAMRQPAFILIVSLTCLFLLTLKYIPFFVGKGGETKFYIECSLAMILLGGLTLGVWLASSSVAEEIEGRTAMTLLSKPINRRQFVVGKYIGLMQALLVMVCVTGAILYFSTYDKTGYDAREASSGRLDFVHWTDVSWLPFRVPTAVPERWEMATSVIPGLALIFMEIAVLTALSVAISTRVPMIVNVVACLTVFVVGHLTPVMVQAAGPDQVIVVFVARLFATVLPSLASFNMDAAIATGRAIPADYIGWCAVYSLSYISAAVLLAFILFEDRDLA